MADGVHAPGTHYRAFLSYSHKDEALAGKLHRRLESYLLPKNLIGTETPRGPVPAKLSPIFRDREELSAGESLSDRIRAALEASESLIVLCSPHAKASHWVAQEIRLFRELHPDRPVLAALIEGEPEEAFPGPLTEGGAEPIAPDFRKGKDGFRLGLLKLVAGISGVPLDALVQRDAQRQLRRVTAITGGALVAVLIMSLLLVTAVRAQREAERQRAEAEGLVEYMLTDLRDRLKGVGRLDVMGAVNERAMKYYGEQGDLSALPADSLLRRARILHAMGEDDDARGQNGLARRKFLEAHRTTAEMLARDRDNVAAIFAHSQSEYWMGFSSLSSKDRASALAGFLKYRILADDLVNKQPDNAKWRKEAAYAEGNVCTALLEPPVEAARAVDSCKASLEKMQIARESDKSDMGAALSIPNRHGWLADAYVAAGDEIKTLEHRRRRLTISDEFLRENPKDARWQESAMLARFVLGTYLLETGDIPEGRKLLTQAGEMAEMRIALNPDDAKVPKFLADINRKLANGRLLSNASQQGGR